MNKLLVVFKDNYADEFDVEGFAVVDQLEWARYIEHLLKDYGKTDTITWYLGSNEEIYWESSMVQVRVDTQKGAGILEHQSALTQLLNSYEVQEITDEQYNMFKELFGVNAFGMFPWIGW